MKKEYMDIPLSNVDIHNAILKFDKDGAQIFDDKNIEPNTNIETIFNNRGHCIMFHKYKNDEIGHWYCLLRDRNKNAIIFDSLAKSPEFYCKNIIPCLKNNGIKNIIVNKKKLQDDNSSVCGRYGLLFSVYNKLGLNINQMYHALDEGKKKHGSYDKYVLSVST